MRIPLSAQDNQDAATKEQRPGSRCTGSGVLIEIKAPGMPAGNLGQTAGDP
jgi:hypothetical protein